jgi:hypothetical protein
MTQSHQLPALRICCLPSRERDDQDVPALLPHEDHNQCSVKQRCPVLERHLWDTDIMILRRRHRRS